mmetsp:Transcript_3044/g.6490  ORF Transcript_3044/g.6490 Transcript_3044/m.6490 type:complete len:335 (+) Transcript_3044:1414-2418(+)
MGLLAPREDLLRLRHKVAALVPLIRNDLFQHRDLLYVGLKLHLMLQVDLLHRGLDVPDNALQLHLRLRGLHKLLLGGRHGLLRRLQLELEGLELPRHELLFLLELFPKRGLLADLGLQVLDVLSKVLGLHGEHPVTIQELPVRLLQLLQLRLCAIESLGLPLQVYLVCPVLHAQVIELLLHGALLLSLLRQLLVEALVLVPQEVSLVLQLAPHVRLILDLTLELPHLALLVGVLLREALVGVRLLLELLLQLADLRRHAVNLLLQLPYLLLVALLLLRCLHDALLVSRRLRFQDLQLRLQALELHLCRLLGHGLLPELKSERCVLLLLFLQLLA